MDWVRAASALAVMLGHARNAFLLDYPEVPHPGPGLTLFYLLTGLGHQAVMVFFVLSGYFVGGVVLRSAQNFDWTHHGITRLSRLWTVLVPALAFTALCDAWLLQARPDLVGSTTAATWHSFPSATTYSRSWGTALGNLAFLQNIATPTFGSNGALWSLSNEAWYYLVFPLAVVGLSGRLGRLQHAALLVLASLGLLLMPGAMRWLFPVWLMGAALHGIRPGTAWPSSRTWGALTGLFFLATLLAVRSVHVPVPMEPLADLLVGLAFALWCAHWHARACSSRPGRPSRVLDRLGHGLSEMSFSLYVVHMPLIFLVAGLALPNGKRMPDALGMGFTLAAVGLVLAVATAFWWVFERNTPLVRRTAESLLRVRPPARGLKPSA